MWQIFTTIHIVFVCNFFYYDHFCQGLLIVYSGPIKQIGRHSLLYFPRDFVLDGYYFFLKNVIEFTFVYMESPLLFILFFSLCNISSIWLLLRFFLWFLSLWQCSAYIKWFFYLFSFIFLTARIWICDLNMQFDVFHQIWTFGLFSSNNFGDLFFLSKLIGNPII